MGGKEGRKRGGKEGGKKTKRKKKRQKIEVWLSKKVDFAVKNLGSFFKSGMGRLSKSMKIYTPVLLCSLLNRDIVVVFTR